MIEQNGNDSSKKILLSVLGVAILIVAVVGVSFAVFSFEKISGDNSISTGTITVTYNEPSNGINITNALPMKDDEVIKSLKSTADMFEFTVSTKASGKIDIPYEISLTEVNDDSLAEGTEALKDSEVKVSLTDGQDSEVVGPKLMSEVKKSTSTLRPGSYILHTVTDSHNGGGEDGGDTITKTYRLRMWVADTVVFGDDGKDSTKTKYTYKLKVNVDSHVKPIGSVE